ncbi:MAG: GNAT family N-acetyltransferase [Candidatus Pacebacteria bacterium]|nr:GNAT family N-acetyltransferase [Candidatus Paceibacterota bacterium]
MKSVRGFWDKSWRNNVIQSGIKASNGLSFVYEENGNILGFICAHDLGFRGYLSELIVASGKQHQGIGKKLLVKVESELNKRGCCVLISDVWKGAKRFYENSGWSEPDVVLLRKKL